MIKLVKQWALVAFLAVFTVSCSSDDNEVIRPDVRNQKEISKVLDFEAEYDYYHAGNNIPFIFEHQSITIAVGSMLGSEQENETYNILNVYENTITNVRKVVTKANNSPNFRAFYYKNKTSEAMDFNMDGTYDFKTENEAINAAYPTEDIVRPDHDKGVFGWLHITSDNKATNLPINGTYRIDINAMGMTMFYSYGFTNETVHFDGTHTAKPYDMDILAYNENTKKLLLKGIQAEVSEIYYVIQLKQITEYTTDIARVTLKTKAEAEALFADFNDITADGFSTYTKQVEQSLEGLTGIYQSKLVEGANPIQYEFHIGTNEEAFVFMADMATGALTNSAALTLKREYVNPQIGQIIYLITDATGYYSTRKGEYLTLYVKDITKDAQKATFSIATKAGTSIANSAGDILGKTIDQAKAITPPSPTSVWENDMYKYAAVWITTTKK